MVAQRKPFYTPEEYLELERKAEFRSEYSAGQIFAMAGGSPTHNAIIFNVSGALAPQLKGGPCRGYSTDMRLRVGLGTMYTYADLVIVCGEPRFADDRQDNLVNPTLIVEVLSDSTEAYDRGEKAAYYRKIDSLQAYVLVSLSSARVERQDRTAEGKWEIAEAEGLEAEIALPSIGCVLRLADVYDRVEFSERAERPKLA